MCAYPEVNPAWYNGTYSWDTWDWSLGKSMRDSNTTVVRGQVWGEKSGRNCEGMKNTVVSCIMNAPHNEGFA